MKKRFYIPGLILLIILSLGFVDRILFMKKRVLRHNSWDNDTGKIYDRSRNITRGTLFMKKKCFEGNMMIFDYGDQGKDTLILKYQYFSTMKVMDPKTGKTGKYSMKGASWVDYFFRKKK
ncbi:MAG: hypothetical protein LBV74_00325 [Tannerella sp.]|nr:hypothetical protein [Tannerella sp.]